MWKHFQLLKVMNMASKYTSTEYSGRANANDSQRDLPRMGISRRMTQQDYTVQASGAIILGIGIVLGWFMHDYSGP